MPWWMQGAFMEGGAVEASDIRLKGFFAKTQLGITNR
jgi:hypothetical protein